MSDPDQRQQPAKADGYYVLQDSQFRDSIEVGGKFPPEKGRYHLYVSYACPWAHRTLIARKLKGLQDLIDVTVVSPRMDTEGWPFGDVDNFPGAEPDPLHGAKHVRNLYFRADPSYDSRFTVPILWDKKQNTIVNNESSEILRIFNTRFNSFLSPEFAKIDLYPANLRSQIDEMDEWVYTDFNYGVYRAGLAKAQEPYEEAARAVFAALDRLQQILSNNGGKFFIGDQLTEVDVRVYTTLVRFDIAYYGGLFKLNVKNIRSGYPTLNAWMKKLYWTNDAFKSTTYFDHCKAAYYSPRHNPNGIVPVGPLPPIEPLT